MSPSIKMVGVGQSFPAPSGDGTIRVVDKIDLSIEDPSINMLLGPSGCGKSTILKMMGGVRPFGVPSPTEGEVFVNGEACYGAHDDVVRCWPLGYLSGASYTIWVRFWRVSGRV